MGASNVVKVFTYWPHLSHREARALLYMANVAYDINAQHPGPPVYYGNWENLAHAMGRPVPTGDLTDAEKKRKATAASEVSRVRRALVEMGALIRGPRPRIEVNAEYALALDPAVGYTFSGSGRAITWSSVQRRDPRPGTVAGFPHEFPLGVTDFPHGVVADFPHVGGLTGCTSDTSNGCSSDTTHGCSSDTTHGCALDTTPGTTPGLTQEYREEEGEPQATHLRAVPGFPMSHPEEELSFEAEKQRQMRELRKRHAEYEADQRGTS